MFEIHLLEKPNLKTAITSMYMSKGNEQEIINDIQEGNSIVTEERMKLLKKWGINNQHYKLIESIYWSYFVKGLSRGGYDDLRTHGIFSTFVAKSTRYCDKFKIAPYYSNIYGKSMTKQLEDEIKKRNQSELFKQDIVRGFYPLSIETPFTLKTNLHHFLHMINQRGPGTHAHKELQKLMRELVQALDINNKQCKWVEKILLHKMLGGR